MTATSGERRPSTPAFPAPGTADLVSAILAAYAYHLNIMPLDAAMPDPAELVRGFDITPPREDGDGPQIPAVVAEDADVRLPPCR